MQFRNLEALFTALVYCLSVNAFKVVYNME